MVADDGSIPLTFCSFVGPLGLQQERNDSKKEKN